MGEEEFDGKTISIVDHKNNGKVVFFMKIDDKLEKALRAILSAISSEKPEIDTVSVEKPYEDFFMKNDGRNLLNPIRKQKTQREQAIGVDPVKKILFDAIRTGVVPRMSSVINKDVLGAAFIKNIADGIGIDEKSLVDCQMIRKFVDELVKTVGKAVVDMIYGSGKIMKTMLEENSDMMEYNIKIRGKLDREMCKNCKENMED